MRNHELAATPETKSNPPQQVAEQPMAAATSQTALAPKYDPLTGIMSRFGGAANATAHATMLNRATGVRPARAGHSLLQLQRQYGNQYVQRVLSLARQAAGEAEAAPEIEQSIQQAHGGGQTLDSGVLVQMESAFGADFSGVRVHTDAQADILNRALSARAFTTGQDIFFKQGEYSPGSSGGRELLAHELTHVVQQTGSIQPKLTIGQPGDPYEQEADSVAKAVMRMPIIPNTDRLAASKQAHNNYIQRQENKVDISNETTEQRDEGGNQPVTGVVPPQPEEDQQTEKSSTVQRKEASIQPIKLRNFGHPPLLLQRSIDTSVLLHTYSLSTLDSAIPITGDIIDDMKSRASASFGARDPVLNIEVVDKWYYYNPLFTNSVYATRSWSLANLLVPNNGYIWANDLYNMNFVYRNTATRSRRGQFATSSGRSTTVTDTVTGGAKLTLGKLELSGSASSSTASGTAQTTTVTATDFYEHDYDVSVIYNVWQYYSFDATVDRSGFGGPEILWTRGPHYFNGIVAVGSITLYDDDPNPDNLMP
jgi:hypothetical protein